MLTTFHVLLLQANQLRTVVKAVGELDINKQAAVLNDDDEKEEDGLDFETEVDKDFAVKIMDEPPVDPRTYKPTIVRNEKGILEWDITETDVKYLADGKSSHFMIPVRESLYLARRSDNRPVETASSGSSRYHLADVPFDRMLCTRMCWRWIP